MKVGIDVIEIERVSLDEKFINRIANENEKAYIDSFATVNGEKERLAGLWCVKEAVFKALELGDGSGVFAHDVELCHEESGKPFVKLYGVAEKKFKKLKLKKIEVSLSHSKTVATAICIVE